MIKIAMMLLLSPFRGRGTAGGTSAINAKYKSVIVVPHMRNAFLTWLPSLIHLLETGFKNQVDNYLSGKSVAVEPLPLTPLDPLDGRAPRVYG